LKILAGNSNPAFAATVARYLDTEVSNSQLKTFSDQEIWVRIADNMRGEDCYIIQSTCCPANDNLMELLICIDALKRASARRITAVLPYFGYARQDRKGGRTAISAKLVADLLTTAGAHRVLTMDLHAGQIEGFFNIPIDNLMAMPTLANDIRHKFGDQEVKIISPDVGGVARARALAGKLNCGLAIVDKRREQANVSEVMNIIGDVKGFHCILFDDIVDTAGTLCHAAEALMNDGAASVSAYVSHGVLSGKAYQNIGRSPLSEVVITDSIPLQAPNEQFAAEQNGIKKVRRVTVADLFGEAIRRASRDESISLLNN
jgi:ribose-phosphate pyrophosphokinase